MILAKIPGFFQKSVQLAAQKIGPKYFWIFPEKIEGSKFSEIFKNNLVLRFFLEGLSLDEFKVMEL